MVINQNHFPVRIGLIQHRLQCAAQKMRVVVSRDDYGDKRVSRDIHTLSLRAWLNDAWQNTSKPSISILLSKSRLTPIFANLSGRYTSCSILSPAPVSGLSKSGSKPNTSLQRR